MLETREEKKIFLIQEFIKKIENEYISDNDFVRIYLDLILEEERKDILEKLGCSRQFIHLVFHNKAKINEPIRKMFKEKNIILT